MSEQNTRITGRVGYDPHFSWRYLLPKYWGIWVGIAGLLLLAYVPYRWRDAFAAQLAKIIGKKAKKQRHRARVNLSYCFPDWSEQQKELVIDKMFVNVTQTMLAIGEVALRSKAHLSQRVEFLGLDYIRQARVEGQNVILLVPHTWAIDASGIILHTQGMPMTAMYNPHRNPLVDWLWNRTRERFGGKMHARQNGIKPFLNAVRRGELGYYLPDEDYGEALSVYADFFATYKATLPGLNKMAKVAKAVVIPMFPRYDAKLGKYQLDIHPPMKLSNDDHEMATFMNQEIESYVRATPEQYVWILRLLKTRRDGQDIYKNALTKHLQ
ncbi:lauroyl-Kdo(2)-lipid IV(A) myristoyltransferase [Testudinibacter sp. TR-2022]|uniref:lauroyl-Kdo(2)-lipid IV(A) myristoyltransferase n=1 Tax=Testudinibacter sp. TR-2022 TaxID=2585029 RepID=UPI00111ABC7A|nr:lauroyl-Kdo(2)-lipid IV(A) myristoyltransferase [Testudinibacter sp. TR-2022]TNH07506.1 lauroyl-Kdo(2)-lipid IV(A) myristoyltransferase [Pasteurellaceae bacterium Phil11]TNH22669.1 lauroyl-Kdo(2)-lipid IV(A) myristoyltransferase [Testudinibacter sp. TR-2022]TNH28954.1 lauroyl-Kdo(2)-lipid IV(A) myristoyltransferase [Testudinibacter sp. TR-2022]